MFLRRLTAVLSLICLCMSGCAPLPAPTAPPPHLLNIQLVTKNHLLRTAAIQTLKRNGITVTKDKQALALFLYESSSEKRSAIAIDGSIGSYHVDYALTYRLGDGENRRIIRDETVDHNENALHSSRKQRQSVVNDLRRNALAQILYILESEAVEK